MLRTVRAARYVLPLREGSSVPALLEADDLGLYVVKLRGAGQGAKALIAELLAGSLAQAAGLAVPEIVLVDLERALAASEPDPELCAPLERSAGLNLGLDYLPGSITFDPVVGPPPDATTASRMVLFDAFVTNVDRTPRNPNLLFWHKRIWAIDHGASLYFHHGWTPATHLDGSRDPFSEVRDHVLLRWAASLDDAAEHLRATMTPGRIDELVESIPDSWLSERDGFSDVHAHRGAYAAWLHARTDALPIFLEEAKRVRDERV
jgi:hypothetical protein